MRNLRQYLFLDYWCKSFISNRTGRTFPEYYFPISPEMHDICKGFWRDTGVRVNKSSGKFYFQDFCMVIIFPGAQDPGFNGLSFH